MADPLYSAKVKLARANLHAGTTQREARRFINKWVAPPVEIKPETELRELSVGDSVKLLILFGPGEAWPDLPDSFAPRFGDAIHNYRSALDHLAWQLVRHGSDPNPARPRRVQFPIYAKQTDFRNELATRLPGVNRKPGGPCEFIEARHGYHGGNARNTTLLRLADLSNDDKHRTLHMMVTALRRAEHEVTFTNCLHTEFRNAAHPPRLEPGAVIAHLTVVVTGDNPQVEVTPSLSAYIALEGWANAMDILVETHREVSEIVNAPEIAAALK